MLRRELIVSVRRGTAFAERRNAVLLVTAIVACVVVAWDWWSWDRASVAGAHAFALTTFGLIVAGQAVLVMVLVPAWIAPAIASERDRKSLDSLLATRISAADIVLGTMGAGLLRAANVLLAPAPVILLMVTFGGVDPGMVLLAVAGLTSTAFALAALAVAVSAGARTASWAMSLAGALWMTWLWLPGPIAMFLPAVWPAAVPWMMPITLRVLDSSPIGVGLNLLGMVARGPLPGAVLRMIAMQTAAGVGLALWAVARLRPASRALYDREGRAALRRERRARWRPRPPCGDDPVLWHEMHGTRPMGPVSRAVDRLFHVLWLGLLAYATSWFAGPAFAELFRSGGYGPVPGRSTLPEENPFARVLVGKLTNLPVGLTPGLARLEFNVVLRQATFLLDFLYVLIVAGAAAESVTTERERDTWPGLIATPLTGWEILRAKILGSLWRTRGLALLMLAFWTVGLLAGAVHPLGFLVATAGLVISAGYLAVLGVALSLWARDRGQATGLALGSLMLVVSLASLPLLWPGTASLLMAAGTIPFQAWASLLSYEDVHAALHARVPPQFAAIGIRGAVGVRIVLAGWLLGTTGRAVGAILLTRAAVRSFDAAVGRPIHPRAAKGR